jgi:hypothetical protein
MGRKERELDHLHQVINMVGLPRSLFYPHTKNSVRHIVATQKIFSNDKMITRLNKSTSIQVILFSSLSVTALNWITQLDLPHPQTWACPAIFVTHSAPSASHGISELIFPLLHIPSGPLNLPASKVAGSGPGPQLQIHHPPTPTAEFPTFLVAGNFPPGMLMTVSPFFSILAFENYFLQKKSNLCKKRCTHLATTRISNILFHSITSSHTFLFQQYFASFKNSFIELGAGDSHL